MSEDLTNKRIELFSEIRNLIEDSKQRVAVSVNAEITML